LNNLVYWISQIFASFAIGWLLDNKSLSRRLRAFSGWAALFAMVWIVHIWAYFYQRLLFRNSGYFSNRSFYFILFYDFRTYTRQSIPPDSSKMDIYSKAYPAHIWLYIFCGLLDAMWQITAYWMMGAMSNDPAKLAYFIGFCMSILYLCDSFGRFTKRCSQINPFNRQAVQVFGAQMPSRFREYYLR
jgi:hypothetical protein